MHFPSQSKVDAVHRTIEQRIFSGNWRIGEQIPTESELALEFDCSRATVSKALARLTHDGVLERRTRKGTRVLADCVQRSKPGMELDSCAFIYPSEQHEGIYRIGQGFQRAANQAGHRVITLATGLDFKKEAEILERLCEFDVKGAVVYPVLSESAEKYSFEKALRSCRFPVVLTEIIFPSLRFPAVVIDGFHAGYTMTRHLLAQGKKHIGFMMGDAGGMPSSCSRYLGYRHAMEEASAEQRPEWICFEPVLRIDFDDPIAQGRLLAKRFLKKAIGLEGVICSDDFLALGCLLAADELNISVPQELKVVGTGDFTIASKASPPLTTYRISYETMGEQAFRMLDCLMQGKTLSATELQVRGDIVARKSG